jgi:hypothetical protein
MRTLSVGQLLLDPINPRHEPVTAQDEAISAVIAEQGARLVALMRHIAENGMSPIDRMLVIPDGRRYVVVEGNRRIAALKLLDNPDLAGGTSIAAQVKRVSKAQSQRITKVDCAIAEDREEARPWILLRHDGESAGAGTVRWRGRQKARFTSSPGSQAGKGNAFLDAVEAAYPDDEELLDLANQVGAERITTLGRVVSSPVFKQKAGYVEQHGAMQFHHDAASLKPFVQRLLRDIATDYNVTKLKSKEQREAYVRDRLPTPDPSSRSDSPRPLGSPQPVAAAPEPKPKPTPRPRPPKPAKLFSDVTLDRLGPRIDGLLREIQKFDVESYPQTAAILIRVLLELSVDRVIELKGWSNNGKLRERVKRVLHNVDPTDKDKRFQTLRTGLSDGTSLYAVSTMHSYLHNQHVHPGPSEARSSAANIEAFLQAVNDLA